MAKRIFLVTAALLFSSSILFISVLKSASLERNFTGPVSKINSPVGEDKVEYNLPYYGTVIPGNILWPVKSLRDKIWLLITTDKLRQAEILLLFADKRLGASLVLFERGQFDLGFSTLVKAENYLKRASDKEEQVRSEGVDTLSLSEKLTMASLKHLEVMEEISRIAPEDARPKIDEIKNITRGVFEMQNSILRNLGFVYPH